MKNTGIISLESSNVMRLKAVSIKPDGSPTVIIGGNNGQGKTSVIDSIMFALSGDRSLPAKPIRSGTDKAKIVIEIDGYTITKTITEKGTQLKVTTADGAVMPSAQSFLNSFVGKLSFDPLAFSRMDARKQAEELRVLTGIDTTDLDQKRKEAFENRADENRSLRSIESALAGMTYHDEAPDEEVFACDLINELQAAQQSNNARDRLFDSINQTSERMKNIDRELRRLESERGTLAEKMKSEKAELKGMPQHIDTDEIRERIESASFITDLVRANASYKEAEQSVRKFRAESDTITATIEQIDAQKAEMLRTAKYPIEGLGFDEDGIVKFNGIPFGQASSAEQIRVSVAIGLAMNPKLPVILIRDGSLLDMDSLAMIEEIATKNNAQIWIERVGEGDEVSVIIEDGSVKGADEEAGDQGAA